MLRSSKREEEIMTKPYDFPEVLRTVALVANYREGGIFARGFSTTNQWKRHPQDDDDLQILRDPVTPTLKTTGKKESADHKAGMIAIMPQNTRHQFYASNGVTLITTTPKPMERIVAETPL